MKPASLILSMACIAINYSAFCQLKSTSTHPDDTTLQYEVNKKIPGIYRRPILKALSYFPELKEVPVQFILKKKNSTFTTVPTFLSIFQRKGRRTYKIIISKDAGDTLAPLLFQNLAYEAQVGVIGHELSHVADFNSRNFCQSMGMAAGHLSGKYVDKMEYNTDLICIQHGMGPYLLAYSRHIRTTMKVKNWRGSNLVHRGNGKGRYERYMNPDTIQKLMYAQRKN